MIFGAVMNNFLLYNKLNSFFIFKLFPGILKLFIMYKTKYSIESALCNIKSLSVLLYEYASFLNTMKCEYDKIDLKNIHENSRNFSITYSENEKIINDKLNKYISRLNCNIIGPNNVIIGIKCSYDFSDNTLTPNIISCLVSFSDKTVNYTVTNEGLNSFYTELFEYIEENIIRDSMLIFSNYVIIPNKR